jgi:hypothetical protein
MSLAFERKLFGMLLFLCCTGLLVLYVSKQITQSNFLPKNEHKVETATRASSRPNVTVIPRGDVTSRIRNFNSAIDSYRSQLLSSTLNKNQTFSISPVKQLIAVVEHKVETATRASSRPNVTVIPRGDVTSRIWNFSGAVDSYRSQLLQNTMNENQTFNISPVKQLIAVVDDGYLAQLHAFEHIVTMTLPWQHFSANDYTFGNLLVRTYFPWIGGKNLCNLIERKSILPSVYVKMFRQMKCSTDYRQAMVNTSLNYGHMKAYHGKRYTRSFYATPPQNILYIHILKSDTVVTAEGDVISGGVMLVGDYCSREKINSVVTPSEYTRLPIYDEVFAIKHRPGGAVYHGLIEELPRIMPFVDFLKSHSNIKIHATAKRRSLQMLQMIGFNMSRIVHGPVRARVVYVPRHAFCMLARVTEIQMMSSLYRSYIHTNFPKRPRDRIVLIIRSGKRRFQNSKQIEAVVKKAAEDNQLKYSVFGDNPVPTLNETMVMFQSAVMVVAAHGAGLSNIVFSEPETFVIEMVPYSKITPLCFLHLAHVLGQHWHGILSRRGGFSTVSVPLQELNGVIRQYLALPQSK